MGGVGLNDRGNAATGKRGKEEGDGGRVQEDGRLSSGGGVQVAVADRLGRDRRQPKPFYKRPTAAGGSAGRPPPPPPQDHATAGVPAGDLWQEAPCPTHVVRPNCAYRGTRLGAPAALKAGGGVFRGHGGRFVSFRLSPTHRRAGRGAAPLCRGRTPAVEFPTPPMMMTRGGNGATAIPCGGDPARAGVPVRRPCRRHCCTKWLGTGTAGAATAGAPAHTGGLDPVRRAGASRGYYCHGPCTTSPRGDAGGGKPRGQRERQAKGGGHGASGRRARRVKNRPSKREFPPQEEQAREARRRSPLERSEVRAASLPGGQGGRRA